MKKAADSQRNAKKIESRQWEKTGKITMAERKTRTETKAEFKKLNAKS
jgi:hypothetical protein